MIHSGYGHPIFLLPPIVSWYAGIAEEHPFTPLKNNYLGFFLDLEPCCIYPL